MKNNKVIYEYLKSKGFKLTYQYDDAFTFATLQHKGSPYFMQGVSYCSDKDQFVKQKGREHALRRALHTAMKEGLLTAEDIAYCMGDKTKKPKEIEPPGTGDLEPMVTYYRDEVE